MRRIRRTTAGAALCTLLLTGCGGSPTGDGGSQDPAGDGPTAGSDGDADELQEEIEAARELLGDQDATVVTAEQVTWSDGALGCPEPDMAYTQALVDGYRIVLEHDGVEVAFHGEQGGAPFRCDDPQPPAE